MSEINPIQDKTGGGKRSKKAMYESASHHAIKAINRLAELIDSKNEPVAVSASKALLAKCLPDLKAIEIESDVATKLLLDLFKKPSADK